MEDKIIERTTKQSLSFIEQLQNQIQLCREALSAVHIPLTPKVQALESLLWAKLKEDKEYNQTMKKFEEWLKNKTEGLKTEKYLTSDMKKYYSFSRRKAREQFKAIMVFIDKKGYMPIGDY
jgi:hypothetical protein